MVMGTRILAILTATLPCVSRVRRKGGEGGHLIGLSLFTDDEAETERRKVDCLDDMQFLEQQFSDLKEL